MNTVYIMYNVLRMYYNHSIAYTTCNENNEMIMKIRCNNHIKYNYLLHDLNNFTLT